MMTMTMSGYDYDAHRPHSHSSGNGHAGAHRGGNGYDKCREWELALWPGILRIFRHFGGASRIVFPQYSLKNILLFEQAYLDRA